MLDNLRIKDIHEKVNDFMLEALFKKENEAYLSFLVNKRKLSIETIKRFKIGLSLERDVDTYVSQLMKNSSFKKTELSLYHKEKGSFLFYNRFMFPIRNKEWETLAYSGLRMFSDMEPKYINSVTNSVYNKGEHLFNLDKVSPDSKSIFICEGNIDSIQLYNYGSKNAVSILGTGLTDQQISLIKDFENIILIFDNDTAGRKAIQKYSQKFAEINKRTYFFPLWNKDVKDIDDFLKRNPELKWKVDDFINENKKDIFLDILIPQYTVFKDSLSLEDKAGFLQKINDFYKIFPADGDDTIKSLYREALIKNNIPIFEQFYPYKHIQSDTLKDFLGLIHFVNTNQGNKQRVSEKLQELSNTFPALAEIGKIFNKSSEKNIISLIKNNLSFQETVKSFLSEQIIGINKELENSWYKTSLLSANDLLCHFYPEFSHTYSNA